MGNDGFIHGILQEGTAYSLSSGHHRQGITASHPSSVVIPPACPYSSHSARAPVILMMVPYLSIRSVGADFAIMIAIDAGNRGGV
jgi:hypothetical protein